MAIRRRREQEALEEDEAPKKRRVVEDVPDEDEAPPKKKRARDEDEEEPEPRKKRAPARDEDDDEEDEPKPKAKRRADDDDDEDDGGDGETFTWSAVKQAAKNPNDVPDGNYVGYVKKAKFVEPSQNEEGDWRSGGWNLTFGILECTSGKVEEPEDGWASPRMMFRTAYKKPTSGQKESMRINKRDLMALAVAALGEDYFDAKEEVTIQEMMDALVKERAEFAFRVHHETYQGRAQLRIGNFAVAPSE